MADDKVEAVIGADVSAAVQSFEAMARSFTALQKQVDQGKAAFTTLSTVIDGISFQNSLAGLSEFERAVKVTQEQFRSFAAAAGTDAGEIAAGVELIGEAAREGLQIKNFDEITRALDEIARAAKDLEFTGPTAEVDRFVDNLKSQLESGEISLEQFEQSAARAAEVFGQMDASRVTATLAEFDQAMQQSEAAAEALGTSVGDRLAEQINLTEGAITTLISQGLLPTDERVRTLSEQLDGLRSDFSGVQQSAASSAGAVGEGAEGFTSLQAAVTTAGAALAGAKAAIDIATGALRELGQALSTVVNAAADEQDAFAQLRNALANAGAEVDGNVKRFAEMAASLQDVTRVGDETTIAAQALAIRLGILPNEMERVIAAAADLAAGSGRDLQSAVEIIGRSAQGAGRGLQQFGISLDDTGSRTLNLQNVLDALEGKFRDAARAAGGTFRGELTRTNNAFGDLLESIGKLVIENEKFVAAMDAVRTALQGMTADVNRASAISELLARGVLEAADIVLIFAQGLIGLAGAAAFAANVLTGRMFEGLDEFTTLLGRAYDEMEQLRQSLQGVRTGSQGIADEATESIEGLAETSGEAVDEMKKLAAAAGKTGDRVATALGSDVSQKVQVEVQEIGKRFRAEMDEIAAKADTLGPRVYTSLDQAREAFDAATTHVKDLRVALGEAAASSPAFTAALAAQAEAASRLNAAEAVDGIQQLDEKMREFTANAATAGLPQVEAAIVSARDKLIEFASGFGISASQITEQLATVEAAIRQTFAEEFFKTVNEQLADLNFNAAIASASGLQAAILGAQRNVAQLAAQAGVSGPALAAAMAAAGTAAQQAFQAQNFKGAVDSIQAIIDKANELTFVGPRAEMEAFRAKLQADFAAGKISVDEFNTSVAASDKAFAALEQAQGLSVLKGLRETFSQVGEEAKLFGTRVTEAGAPITQTGDLVNLAGQKIGSFSQVIGQQPAVFDQAATGAQGYAKTLDEQVKTKVDAVAQALRQLSQIPGVDPKIIEGLKSQLNSTNPSIEAIDRLIKQMGTSFTDASTAAQGAITSINQQAAVAAAEGGPIAQVAQRLTTVKQTLADGTVTFKIVNTPALEALDGIATKVDEVKERVGGESAPEMVVQTEGATKALELVGTQADELKKRFERPIPVAFDTQSALASLGVLLAEMEKVRAPIVVAVDAAAAVGVVGDLSELLTEAITAPRSVVIDITAALQQVAAISAALDAAISKPRVVPIIAQTSGSPTLPFSEYWGSYAPKVLEDFTSTASDMELTIPSSTLDDLDAVVSSPTQSADVAIPAAVGGATPAGTPTADAETAAAIRDQTAVLEAIAAATGATAAKLDGDRLAGLAKPYLEERVRRETGDRNWSMGRGR